MKSMTYLLPPGAFALIITFLGFAKAWFHLPMFF